MAACLKNRPRTQNGLDVLARRKPQSFSRLAEVGRFKPNFIYAPGLSNPGDIDLVSRTAGAWTVHSGTVTSQHIPQHGRSTNFPGDGSTGLRGAKLVWAGLGNYLRSTDFAVQVIFRYEGLGTTGASGIFTGGFGVSGSNRSWIVSLQSSTLRFKVYNSTTTYKQVISDTLTVGKLYNAVGIKRGSKLNAWLNGEFIGTETLTSGSLNQSDQPALLGVHYSDYTTSYPFNGDLFLAQYWREPLWAEDAMRLSENPYLALNDGGFLRYPTSVGGGYWGLDYYLKHIAGM